MRLRGNALLTSMFLILSMGQTVFAQNGSPSEYQIKAAFLFNFAKFVEWPPRSLGNAKSPITIAVLGENVFHDDLEKTVKGKSVDDHPILIRFIQSETNLSNCQILFISPSEKSKLPEIIKTLKDSNILTVSQLDGFTQSGGMINFVLEGSKIRFQINKNATSHAGLRMSSKLLALALPSDR